MGLFSDEPVGDHRGHALLGVALATWLVACQAPSTASNDPTASPPATTRATTADAVAAICKAAPCNGKLASITAYRNSAGDIERYVHQGDIGRCSHPPTTYYDADGKEVLAQPNQPVTPGSEEATRFAEERDRALRGLEKSESHDCP